MSEKWIEWRHQPGLKGVELRQGREGTYFYADDLFEETKDDFAPIAPLFGKKASARSIDKVDVKFAGHFRARKPPPRMLWSISSKQLQDMQDMDGLILSRKA